ncbi:MAG: DUF445 family protein [Clostridia bacterium]|nr:DUF445 family protein [Clostridia bacterium]
MNIEFVILPVIGALIGWFTNLLAIKLIFRPLNAVTIPFIGFTIQGVIPKRRNEIARSIGYTVESELLSIQDIIDEIWDQDNKRNLSAKIKDKISIVVYKNIPGLIPGPLKGLIVNYVDKIVSTELEDFLDSSVNEIKNNAIDSIDISNIIETKINEFELENLERIIIDIASNELKYIEILGGIIGGVIGIFQALLLYFMGVV